MMRGKAQEHENRESAKDRNRREGKVSGRPVCNSEDRG